MANSDEQQLIRDASSNAAHVLEEMLEDEQYVYQGKVYSRKRLYRGSSARKLILVVYIIVMVLVMGGVAAWSFGFSFALPSFLLGVDETAAPTVRVPERVVTPPPKVAPLATTTAEQSTSTVGIASTTVTVVATGTSTGATTTPVLASSTLSIASTTPATSTPANTSATVVP